MRSPLHPRIRLAPLAATTALLLSAVSCDGATSPEDISGVWVLDRIGQSPVPSAWVVAYGGNGSIRTLAETLYLRPGRVGEHVAISEYTMHGSSDTIITRFDWAFEYDLSGPHVQLRARDGSHRVDYYDGRSILSSNYVFTYRGRVPHD